MRWELYYAIMNIVDYLALGAYSDEDGREMYKILDKLIVFEADNYGSSIDDVFEAIADANDVGGVKTWQEMVTEIKKLHESGERIPIR